MRKALAMGLGALLAAGSAAPLSAASQIDFSGYYRIFFANETNLGRQAGAASFTDTYFGNRLEFNIDFKPTDELTIFTRLRLPDFRRWGSGNSARNTGSGFQTRHVYGQITQDWGQILVGRLDEDIDNFGLATLGWMPENNPVFTTVSPFDNGDPVDAILYLKKWDNGFSIAAQYAKLDNNANGSEGGGVPDSGDPNSVQGWASDQDFDRFAVEGAYQWDGGGVSLGLHYTRNATDTSWAHDFSNNINGMYVNPSNGTADSGFYVNPAIRHGWENGFSVNFEAMLGWGSADLARHNAFNGTLAEDIDAEGYAAYLDFDYNYGPGNVNLAAWYTSGTDLDNNVWDNGAKSKSLINMGGNFIPLLVAYNDGALGEGRNGLEFGNDNAVSVANNAFWNFVWGAWAAGGVNTDLAVYADYINNNGGGFLNLSGGDTSAGPWGAANNGEAPTVDRLVGEASIFGNFGGGAAFQRIYSFNNNTEANHWAIAISGNHAFTDDIAMHYAVAYLGLNQPSYRMINNALWNSNTHNFTNYGYVEQDKDMGFEVDFGLSFQLLDNLQLTTAFGYMFNGDAFKTLRGYTLSDTASAPNQFQVNAVWEDPDDTYTWLNTLTFSF